MNGDDITLVLNAQISPCKMIRLLGVILKTSGDDGQLCGYAGFITDNSLLTYQETMLLNCKTCQHGLEK